MASQPSIWNRLSNTYLGFASTTETTATKPHIRWWALILGIIGVGLGVWTSFATNTGVVDAQLYVAAIATMIFLIIGIASLARFFLDVITSRNERGAPVNEPQV